MDDGCFGLALSWSDIPIIPKSLLRETQITPFELRAESFVMATGTLPTPPPLPMAEPAAPPLPITAERRLIDEQIDRTRLQVKTVDALFGLLAITVGSLSLFLAAVVVDHWIVGLGVIARATVLASLLAWSGYCAWRWIAPSLLKRINPLYAANAIERQEPSLKNSLINYLLVRSHPEETAVVRDALEKQAAAGLADTPVEAAVDRTHVLRLGYALVAVVLALAVYKVASPKDPFRTIARVLAPLADIARPARAAIREVTPGDAEIFHGRSLTVSAVIEGLRSGEDAEVLYSTADGQIVDAAIPMQRGEDDRRWQCTVPPESRGAQQDFQYRVQAGDAVSEEYRVRISPAPSIVVRSVRYDYPPYTRRQSQTIEDLGDIFALEGTRVTVKAEANLPIQSAWIEFDPPGAAAMSGEASHDESPALKRLPLKAEDRLASGSFRLEWDAKAEAPRHRSYRLAFITAEGDRNERPIVHAIDVARDLPPEVAILDPEKNRIEIPENGQKEIVVRAVDPDFGVSRIALHAAVGGTDLQIPALLSDPGGQTGQVIVKYRFLPREHKLKAGQEVIAWARADDNRTAPGQTAPEPNFARTPNYHFVITPPERSENSSGDGGGNEPSAGENPSEGGDSEKPEEGEKQGSEGGEKSKEPGENGSSSEGGQGGMGQGQSQNGENGEGQSSAPNQGGEGGTREGEGAGQQGGQGSSSSGSSPNPSPQNNGGQGQPSGAGQQQPANDSSAGQGETSGQNSDGQAKPSPQQGQSQQGQPQQGQPQQGQPQQGQRSEGAGQQPLSADGTQDREVFERLQEYLNEQPQNAAGQSSPGAGQSGRQGNSQNNSTQANQPPGDGGNATPSPAPQPGESPQGAGQRNQQNPAQSPDQKQGDAEGQNAGGGQGGSPRGPAETQKEQANPQKQPGDQSPPPGSGDTGNSGAGIRPENPRGSPESQEQNRDRQKNGEGGEKKEADEGASSPSNSKRQSDSQGGEGGDRSGGGKQGGGQGAKQPGNDTPGSSSAAEEGAGAASEAGAGETSNQAGNQQLANHPTGNPSQNTPGEGSGVQQNPQSGPPQASPGPPQASTGSQQPQPGQSAPQPQNSASPPSQNSAPRGNQNGTGQPTFGQLPQGGNPEQSPPPDQTPPPAVPENAQVNLEYSRKVTDLVLEALRDQKQKPDADLLKQLGWTPEDLQRFVGRWEAMKAAAAQEGRAGEEARQSLNETLESLGLRSTNSGARRSDMKSDQQRGLRDSGHRSAPPPEYQKLFDAYRKSAGRPATP